jgi:hypothetical protein
MFIKAPEKTLSVWCRCSSFYYHLPIFGLLGILFLLSWYNLRWADLGLTSCITLFPQRSFLDMEFWSLRVWIKFSSFLKHIAKSFKKISIGSHPDQWNRWSLTYNGWLTIFQFHYAAKMICIQWKPCFEFWIVFFSGLVICGRVLSYDAGQRQW